MRVDQCVAQGGVSCVVLRRIPASCASRATGRLRGEAVAPAGDGKTLRRSHDRRNGLGALHSVSVWASEYGLSLGQVATDGKSNEITAIPELLRLVDIRGAIITIDAMGTQTAIAEQIVEAGADHVLALKENQGTLHDPVIGYVDRQMDSDFADCGAQRLVTEEKAHGREEVRQYVQMRLPAGLAGAGSWMGLLTIGVAMLWCLRDGKEAADIHYFISSLPPDVSRFAHAVRSHWSVENSCHWSLDITYCENSTGPANECLTVVLFHQYRKRHRD